jgi:hypothetical protein
MQDIIIIELNTMKEYKKNRINVFDWFKFI